MSVTYIVSLASGDSYATVFADSGLNEEPNSEALSEIAISSSKSFRQLVGEEPKVAMLSYSTFGSAKSELTDKMVNATNQIKANHPELIIDGELQLDAAIVPEVAKSKAPEMFLSFHGTGNVCNVENMPPPDNQPWKTSFSRVGSVLFSIFSFTTFRFVRFRLTGKLFVFKFNFLFVIFPT